MSASTKTPFTAYTALFGGRDTFKHPAADIDCVVFTDKSPVTPTDRVRVERIPMPVPGDPVRSARYVKLHPHIFMAEYDLTFWIDASIMLKNTAGLESVLGLHEMALFRHPDRDCAYAEAEVCANLRRDDPWTIRKQMERYREAGFPQHQGLVATGGLLRRNTPALADFNRKWWKEIRAGSRRDQLSFNYVAWKNKRPYGTFETGDVYENPWWTVYVHKGPEPTE